jgi:hypothetical protein
MADGSDDSLEATAATTAMERGERRVAEAAGEARGSALPIHLPGADLETKVVKVTSMEEVLRDIKGRLQVMREGGGRARGRGLVGSWKEGCWLESIGEGWI